MTETLSEKKFCYRHADRETLLSCNRCGNPICTQCAILTPTGYRCPECVRGQQKVFNTAKTSDYGVAALISGALAALAAALLSRVSFLGFFLLFIGPMVGNLIARVVQRAVKRRRSKRLYQLATAAAVVGSLIPSVGPFLLVLLFNIGPEVTYFGGSLLGLVWQGLYIFMLASSLYASLRGIQIR